MIVAIIYRSISQSEEMKIPLFVVDFVYKSTYISKVAVSGDELSICIWMIKYPMDVRDLC